MNFYSFSASSHESTRLRATADDDISVGSRETDLLPVHLVFNQSGINKEGGAVKGRGGGRRDGHPRRISSLVATYPLLYYHIPSKFTILFRSKLN